MDQQDQPAQTPDYWNQTAFHQALQSVPFKQRDAAGALVVNVHDHFFKLDAGELVMARVPESLEIPRQWQQVPSNHLLRAKAMSMLGSGVDQ